MTNAETKNRVYQYMQYYGTTAKFIAQQAGVNHTNFSTWINGNKQFSTATLAKINAYIDRMVQGVAI